MDRAREVSGGEGRDPRGVISAHGTDLGHDHEVVGVRMKRFANKLVGDVRAIKIASVNVIDPARHSRPQHGKRGVAILRRSKHARSGELHGAIAQAVHGAVAQ